MKTAIVISETSSNHNTGLGHPENADRVDAIINNLKKNKILLWKKSTKFNNNIINITHSSEYVKNVKESFPKKGLIFLDGDTIVSPGSKDATADAVGSIITAIDGVEKSARGRIFSHLHLRETPRIVTNTLRTGAAAWGIV